HPHLETPHYEIAYNPDGFAPSSYERTEATRSSEKELGYESSEWHLEEADHGHAHVTATASTHAAAQKKANHATQPVAQPSAQKAASPCA
ncbi:hypothetical protein, partial [Escherichia coli]